MTAARASDLPPVPAVPTSSPRPTAPASRPRRPPAQSGPTSHPAPRAPARARHQPSHAPHRREPWEEAACPHPRSSLVHGAWADGSSWNAVASSLQDQGFTVLTPTNLLRGVASDAAYLSSFLAQRTSGPVVLVGHSYGGFVATNGGAGGGDVRALVYVDAFMPDEGETVFQILGGTGSAFDIPDPTVVFDIVGYPGGPEGDAEAFLKADTVHTSFAQDLPEVDRRLIIASQRPITLSANTTPSAAPAWKNLPSWAVIGTEDKVITPDSQRRMAERAGATVSEVPASHVSMVSQPQASLDAILAAAASVDA